MSKTKVQDPNKERIAIELPNKMVVLSLTNFDTDIDTDQIINIHHHNIIGEILTFPVIMNRIGNLKAEMENQLSEEKMDFEIFQANQEEKMRKQLTTSDTDTKGNVKVSKPTKDEVENAVLISPEYKVKKRHLFKVQKNLAYVESLYWAAKDKSSKLDVFSAKLKPEEFEKDILEGTLNGVEILVKRKSIN